MLRTDYKMGGTQYATHPPKRTISPNGRSGGRAVRRLCVKPLDRALAREMEGENHPIVPL